MLHIYLDAEFDAVKINGKFQQAIISIGAIMLDDTGKELDRFYSLVRPMNFVRLTSVVYKMTHLHTYQIAHAHALDEVMNTFMKWINRYEKDIDCVRFYSFGPDDRRTLLQNCRYYHMDMEFFRDMKDLQKEISPAIKFQDQPISSTLSLDDLKSAYDIKGAVDHNALNDAIDLMKVHQAYCLHKPQNMMQIAAIVNRKIKRQQEVALKQRMRLAKVMKERFKDYPSRIHLKFQEDVLEELRMIRERDQNFHIRWRSDRMVMDDQVYYYNELKIVLSLILDDEVPSFCLEISYHGSSFVKQYLLTYRNATMIEHIIKLLMGIA